ncbi:MAG: hypothetical protein HW380_4008, partial [Magnetococcales bacterium]|nr:hypothetical protein [Magnetococcales bacterium]
MKKTFKALALTASMGAVLFLAASSASAWWGPWNDMPWDNDGPWGGGPWGGYPHPITHILTSGNIALFPTAMEKANDLGQGRVQNG